MIRKSINTEHLSISYDILHFDTIHYVDCELLKVMVSSESTPALKLIRSSTNYKVVSHPHPQNQCIQTLPLFRRNVNSSHDPNTQTHDWKKCLSETLILRVHQSSANSECTLVEQLSWRRATPTSLRWRRGGCRHPVPPTTRESPVAAGVGRNVEDSGTS